MKLRALGVIWCFLLLSGIPNMTISAKLWHNPQMRFALREIERWLKRALH